MEQKSADAYRCNMASDMLKEEEDEHPLIYNTNVRREAKHEVISSQYLCRSGSCKDVVNDEKIIGWAKCYWENYIRFY